MECVNKKMEERLNEKKIAIIVTRTRIIIKIEHKISIHLQIVFVSVYVSA